MGDLDPEISEALNVLQQYDTEDPEISCLINRLKGPNRYYYYSLEEYRKIITELILNPSPPLKRKGKKPRMKWDARSHDIFMRICVELRKKNLEIVPTNILRSFQAYFSDKITKGVISSRLQVLRRGGRDKFNKEVEEFGRRIQWPGPLKKVCTSSTDETRMSLNN